MKMTENMPGETTGNQPESWLETVRRQVGSIRFGVVQITVHDAKVVLIEKTEKIRFVRPEKC